jgi:transposase
LYSRENGPERRRNEFAALRRQELKVGRAWAIKEALRGLWFYVYPASGWKFWKRWYFWATHSWLEPIRKAAETVRRHIDNILTYYQHPVTNAMSEGLNSKIQKIKSRPAASARRRTSRRRFTFAAEGSIFTHAEPGST